MCVVVQALTTIREAAAYIRSVILNWNNIQILWWSRKFYQKVN